MLFNRTTHNSSSITRSGALVSALTLALTVVLGLQAGAAVYNVPVGDVLAMVDAIDQDNMAPGYDKIVLEPGLYNLGTTYDGAGATALPEIESYIEITVPGDTVATIRRDPAASWFRLFKVKSSGILRLNRLLLRGGRTGGTGGAIFSDGTVVMLRCVVLENLADTAGAIYSSESGSLSIDDSTIHMNRIDHCRRRRPAQRRQCGHQRHDFPRQLLQSRWRSHRQY